MLSIYERREKNGFIFLVMENPSDIGFRGKRTKRECLSVGEEVDKSPWLIRQ